MIRVVLISNKDRIYYELVKIDIDKYGSLCKLELLPEIEIEELDCFFHA